MQARPGLLILLGLTLAGATCKGASQEATRESSKSAITEEADQIEAQAKQYAPIDSIDITQVPAAQRQDFLRILNETFCYCGCPRTLAACLSNKADCSCVGCSERMTTFIMNHFAAGMATEEVEITILQGFSEGYNGAKREFDNANPEQRRRCEISHCRICRLSMRSLPRCSPILKQLAEQPGIKLSYFIIL